MFCAISGNVPEHPVVSTKSGHLFEKSLIEKYIKETKKDPVTNEELTLEDLLPLKTNKTVKARPSPATSIPGLLGLFHDEWDALMLECHTLRQGLLTARQELSHALYQHDAATRVIARVIKERDDARAALANLREQVMAELTAKRAAEEAAAAEAAAAAAAAASTGEDEQIAKKAKKMMGISEEINNELGEVNATLSKARKKRAVPPGTASLEEVARSSLVGSHPLHKTTAPGITCIAIHPDKENIIATAGVDSSVQLFDAAAERVVSSLEGHSKRVTYVTFLESSTLLTSSSDATIRVWQANDSENGYSCAAVLRDHTSEVVGVMGHPSKKYFLTASADGSWGFYDASSLTCLKQTTPDGSREALTCMQLHPDGIILGCGTATASVRIWELRAQSNVATFEGHTGALRGLSFSENGYYLATAADDGVKLWDLRKLKNFKTLEPYSDSPCLSVSFDFSGLYLAVGGADARVYGQRNEWEVVGVHPEFPRRNVTALKWGTGGHKLYAGSADHNLRVFAAAPAEAAMDGE